MPSKVIRVALLSSEYPPHIHGGLGVHVERMVDAMRASAAFDLFLPEKGDYSIHPDHVRIVEVPAGDAASHMEYWLGYSQQAAQLAENALRDVDLIHCHDWMTILAGIRLRETLRKPLVYNSHLPQNPGLSRDFENLALAAADLVIVNSRSVGEELRARRVPIRQMSIVPNGVDLARFQPHLTGEEGDYVLFVGRLVPQKGVDTLLRALEVVLRRIPECRLLIVGDGDQALYLKRVSHYLGFPDRVAFLGWQADFALVDLYRRAQVVVVPSNYEPFGMVALEAMACARPVLASDVGGLAEFIQDGVHGYLVPPADHLRLARRMAQLLLDPGRRRRMGEAARSHAENYSWESAAKQTLALYRSLVQEPLKPLSGEPVDRLTLKLLRRLKWPLATVAGDLLYAHRLALPAASGRAIAGRT